jgi:hypothetical protein
MIKKEKSEKAKEAIEAALIVIQSVEFLEKQSMELMKSLEILEDKLEKSSCFEERETLRSQIEEYEPRLRQLIRRCQLENENIIKCQKRYNK